MDITFNFEELTIGDIEEIENITGKAYEDMDWNKPSMKLMKAMVFISERRKDPEFTIEDAAKVKLVDLKVGEENPTQGPPEGDAS